MHGERLKVSAIPPEVNVRNYTKGTWYITSFLLPGVDLLPGLTHGLGQPGSPRLDFP